MAHCCSFRLPTSPFRQPWSVATTPAIGAELVQHRPGEGEGGWGWGGPCAARQLTTPLCRMATSGLARPPAPCSTGPCPSLYLQHGYTTGTCPTRSPFGSGGGVAHAHAQLASRQPTQRRCPRTWESGGGGGGRKAHRPAPGLKGLCFDKGGAEPPLPVFRRQAPGAAVGQRQGFFHVYRLSQRPYPTSGAR
jgi:hypothetical protein